MHTASQPLVLTPDLVLDNPPPPLQCDHAADAARITGRYYLQGKDQASARAFGNTSEYFGLDVTWGCHAGCLAIEQNLNSACFGQSFICHPNDALWVDEAAT